MLRVLDITSETRTEGEGVEYRDRNADITHPENRNLSSSPSGPCPRLETKKEKAPDQSKCDRASRDVASRLITHFGVL